MPNDSFRKVKSPSLPALASSFTRSASPPERHLPLGPVVQRRGHESLQNPAVDIVAAEFHGLLRQDLRPPGLHRPCAVRPDHGGLHRSTPEIKGHQGGGPSDVHPIAERGRNGFVERAEHDPGGPALEARPDPLPPAVPLQAPDDRLQFGPVRLVEAAGRGDGDVGDLFVEARLERADDLAEEERSDVLGGEAPPAHARHGPAAFHPRDGA